MTTSINIAADGSTETVTALVLLGVMAAIFAVVTVAVYLSPSANSESRMPQDKIGVGVGIALGLAI
ncbi:hypothetical protein [Gordonia alkanivorans]|uniref:hypothetical protein n=1 Tax=Gordonia alkanivorans TaxID=84096 RepID=UPI0005A60122|nr:hypothetical protein [Gordonia alkanivorans]